MFINFTKFLRSCTRLYFYRGTCAYILDMEKAYFRVSSEDTKFHFAFRYVDKLIRVDKSFNLNRNLTEDINYFTERIAMNLGKVMQKKKSETDDQGVEVTLYLNGNPVPSGMNCSQLFLTEHKVTMKVNVQLFEVVMDPPWVVNISLPSSMFATFPQYPHKFETTCAEKELSSFTWSRSLDKRKWTDIGNTFIYEPKNDDIGYYLKLTCIPKNHKADGPAVEVVSSCTVQAVGQSCLFEQRHLSTIDKAVDDRFRVVTYNILADMYCDSKYSRDMFTYCPLDALDISYRKQLLMKEIIGYNADLICLQEVDRKLYFNDFEPILGNWSYVGNFTPKGEVNEGLAFFYNKKRFKLLESQRVLLAEHLLNPMFEDIWKKIQSNKILAARIREKQTTLQVNTVENLERKEILVVANTHFYFHPDADHIRLLHGGIAIRYLENYVNNLKEQHSDKKVALIFGGDFNSTPNCGVYQLYTTGKVPADFPDYQSAPTEIVEGIEFLQSFMLASAYGTPPYTNFTAQFADCLDYIYYEADKLKITQIVPLPAYEELIRYTALPSVIHPSDHLALIADFKWIEN